MKQTHRCIIALMAIINCLSLYPRAVSSYIPADDESTQALELLHHTIMRQSVRPSCSTTAYTQLNVQLRKSLRPTRLLQCMFGESLLDCNRTFVVAGSQTERPAISWLADHFGLPTDFKSSITMEPRMHTVMCTVDTTILFEGFPHFFWHINAPFAHTSWNLNLHEAVVQEGINNHAAGYFNATGIARADLLSHFWQYATGQYALNAEGITVQKLMYGKMSCNARTKTALSHLYTTLGYTLFQTAEHECALYALATIPTSPRPHAEYLFDATIGNGHHAQGGAGIIGMHCLYQHIDCALYLSYNSSIRHNFKTCHERSFDLVDKPLSKYMLALKMGSPIEDNLVGESGTALLAPEYQYKQELAPVANLTTCLVDVRPGMQTDLAILLTLVTPCYDWHWGYSFWHRSEESIQKRSACALEKKGAVWALKGDAQLFGFEQGSQTPVPLSATQHRATIYQGLNNSPSGSLTPTAVAIAQTNPQIDNGAAAQADSNNDTIFSILTSQPGGSDQIKTSLQPRILTITDIDFSETRIQGTAHSIHGGFSRTWHEHAHQPYISCAAHVTFGSTAAHPPVHPAEATRNYTISRWAVWLAVGCAIL